MDTEKSDQLASSEWKFQARSFFCCCSGFPERTSNICQCLRTRMLQRFDKEKLGAHAFVQNQSLS
jgi:hypothetical protein